MTDDDQDDAVLDGTRRRDAARDAFMEKVKTTGGAMSVFSDGSVAFRMMPGDPRPPSVGDHVLMAFDDPEGRPAGGPMVVTQVEPDPDEPGATIVRADPYVEPGPVD